jgi:hypothetical protein
MLSNSVYRNKQIKIASILNDYHTVSHVQVINLIKASIKQISDFVIFSSIFSISYYHMHFSIIYLASIIIHKLSKNAISYFFANTKQPTTCATVIV